MTRQRIPGACVCAEVRLAVFDGLNPCIWTSAFLHSGFFVLDFPWGRDTSTNYFCVQRRDTRSSWVADLPSLGDLTLAHMKDFQMWGFQSRPQYGDLATLGGHTLTHAVYPFVR